jgi:tRNA nucleotidyltransferase (CCA-adding enzyme)
MNAAVTSAVRDHVRSLGLGAWAVGGSVRDELLGIEHRDEDFVVPGLDLEELRRALEPHGRVEEMVVHGEVKGVRLHPRSEELRRLVPAGIELAPAPGGPEALTTDLLRRDYTVDAMARSLDTGELADPLGGLADLARRELRTVTPRSLADDPLRVLRGLRLVSQLGFAPTGETLAQMRTEAPGLAAVAPERIGGGLAVDGLGELSLLLLGAEPARALRLARETGALLAIVPEFEPVLGHELDSPRQPDALDDHIFEVVQGAADLGASLPVRLTALLHDLGKPQAGSRGDGHAELGAPIAAAVLERLRYPARLVREVAALVRAHSFELDDVDQRRARRFLADHGRARAFELLALKEADLRAKRVSEEEHGALTRLRTLVERELDSPHRLADLAVDGDDLLALGLRQGPEVGRVLRLLLDEVVEEPARNDRDALLRRARQELA